MAGFRNIIQIVQQGGGSSGEVERERLQYDNRNTNRRSIEAPPRIAALIAEMNRRASDTVTAAVLGQANETGRRAVEDVSNSVTATANEPGKRAVDANAVVAQAMEAGRRATDAAAAIIIPTADAGKRAIETTPLSATAVVMEIAKRAVETIQAAVIAAADMAKRAADIGRAIANYAGYANANVSTTTWTNPANFLGNTTGTFAALTATSSGLAGTTRNTVTGIIDVGFADPQITDLPISSSVVVNVERAIVSSGTLPLGQSANLAWQYTLDGTNWVNLQAPDTGAVAKGIISLTLGGAAPDTLNLDDSSGNGRTLTKFGTVDPTTSGLAGFNGAALFTNNLANYLARTDTELSPLSNRPRTWEAVITPTVGTFMAIMGQWNNPPSALAPSDWRMFVLNDGRLSFHWGNQAGGLTQISGTTVMVTGTTYRVAVSTDGTNFFLFVNGNLEATAGGAAGNTNTSQQFQIGRAVNPGDPFNGKIDEIRISSVARYTASYTPASTPFTSDANTLALWHLDTIPGGGGSSITYSQLNNLRVRGNGSVTSGTGLSAQLQAQAFRAWVSFTAAKDY